MKWIIHDLESAGVVGRRVKERKDDMMQVLLARSANVLYRTWIGGTLTSPL